MHLPALQFLFAIVLVTCARIEASTTVYFGNYTKGEGAGVYRADLNEQTGELGKPVLAGAIDSPSFLAIHPMMPRLYAVSEVEAGSVTAFTIRDDGGLEKLNSQPTGGPGPCHVSVDPSGGTVLVANYGGGSCASFPIQPDGSLGPAGSMHQHVGSSINPSRQKGPHAHSILTDPSGHRAFAADLGLDRIIIYQLDSGSGEMVPNEPPSVATPAGGGPRHLAFHPKGQFAYVNLEMSSSVSALKYDADTGSLALIHTVSTLPAGFEGSNSTAETLVHPSGEFVYVSNRGHDSIAVFRVDTASGRLTHLGNHPTLGEVPRNFGITPDGTFLIAGNQKSGTVAVFRVNLETGALESTGFGAEVPSPVCVRFFRR